MTNPDTGLTPAQVYDQLAPEYDETDHQAMRLLEKLEEDVIARELPRYCTDIPHKRIANIGSGTGRHTGFFQRLGNERVYNLQPLSSGAVIRPSLISP
ncbi:MAG TPA: hypothetical protein PKJ68_02310 [Candidatus Woesebacteria bacterium]|nr:hypothetical protein [Candidatus Woesebacteria bacterium]